MTVTLVDMLCFTDLVSTGNSGNNYNYESSFPILWYRYVQKESSEKSTYRKT